MRQSVHELVSKTAARAARKSLHADASCKFKVGLLVPRVIVVFGNLGSVREVYGVNMGVVDRAENGKLADIAYSLAQGHRVSRNRVKADRTDCAIRTSQQLVVEVLKFGVLSETHNGLVCVVDAHQRMLLRNRAGLHIDSCESTVCRAQFLVN